MPEISLGGTKTLSALALSAFGGFLGTACHIPLAWMLGPLLVTACLSMSGVDLKFNPSLLRLGQLTIGTSVGLNMSTDVLIELVSWLPLIVFSAFFSIIMSCFAGAFLAKHARIDHTTAFFASLPGGLAEMGNVGMRMGAQSEPIAIVHTLRIALVVLVVPPILLALGSPDFATQPATQFIDLYWAPILVIGGAFVAYFFGVVHLNNPYMIGAVVFATIFAANGLVAGKMPPMLFAAAQILIGYSVGCRFRRSMLTHLPRVTLFSTFSILGLVVVMACYALVVSCLSGLPYPAAILATSPGGTAEMVVTAQVLHLAVPTVVGFQVVRGLLVNGLASYYFLLLRKSGLLDFLTRTIGG
ncbi:AbrB family transcriptional regulator [Phyllobacterium endophyticum]|uniref:AbrB family transcriptional regulator n=1 Tax=Phyllobacterium endophyticum TaxID=1149773 RepID=UPI0011C77F32|nr:AbrB family transcriptional regulator [Phyllobacterium endophyticum]TXR47498.1 AbrB family transcriptional regulator [Phyllobacterium endophyticum]